MCYELIVRLATCCGGLKFKLFELVLMMCLGMVYCLVLDNMRMRGMFWIEFKYVR